MGTYELSPKNGRKSFYGKALVEVLSDGTKRLWSYNTCVFSIDADGEMHRHCKTREGFDEWNEDDITPTTMTHIKSFIIAEIDEETGRKFNAAKLRKMKVEPV